MRENKSLYSLLGILSFGPQSGYDIKQMVEQRLSHFWNESYGQIYPNLKRLVDEGLATIHEDRTSSRAKNIYSITERGRLEFHAWLEKPIGNPPPEKNEMLLKLYFGQNRSPKENRELISQYRKQMEAIRDQFARINSNTSRHQGAEPNYRLMTLSFGKHVVEAIIQWCVEQEQYLETIY